ncbi:hypothetical protein OKW41_001673 [Paraburkholderia sp. UCT70]
MRRSGDSESGISPFDVPTPRMCLRKLQCLHSCSFVKHRLLLQEGVTGSSLSVCVSRSGSHATVHPSRANATGRSRFGRRRMNQTPSIAPCKGAVHISYDRRQRPRKISYRRLSRVYLPVQSLYGGIAHAATGIRPIRSGVGSDNLVQQRAESRRVPMRVVPVAAIKRFVFFAISFARACTAAAIVLPRYRRRAKRLARPSRYQHIP